jgi:CRISPR-associated endonuclease/helicase Cas3
VHLFQLEMGYFPSQAEIDALNDGQCGTNEGSDWQLQRFSQRIFEQLQGYVGLTATDLPTSCDNAAAMILAGLTTVSDWIASNPEEKGGFPYANDDMPFDEYAAGLGAKAENALEAIGWGTPLPTKPIEFKELFPQITSPRELQTASIELSKNLTPPCLVLVEASMGEGKTEAALYLADYLQHQTSSGGFYIGLPTQATSNAMWERVRLFLQQRYPEEMVNLTLSHSAAALKEDYQQCRLEKQVYDEPSNRSGQVGASEWHTARKRTMLSPYGVGTIDQGLMGVVRSKHQFVRLFGLAGRTVILDEIHAYDLYTSTLLQRFLEWLAALGSPVIALSATLPTSTREALLKAYAKGCGVSEVEVPQAPYPRITAFSAGEAQVKSFAASEHVCRSLSLNWVDDQEWGNALRDKLQDGGCAAVICSTVGRAQEVFERLQSYFQEEELGLFHGRFLFVDRERIEKHCLEQFGKESQNRPKRYVLVATQVIEQSLDVDFDLMISDLAPIDLLLQRSGRLHRHTRDRLPRLKDPTLWIVSPTVDAAGKVNFAESGIIYDRHILLRTWLTLRDKNFVQLPEEMDELIESVYQLDSEIPETLELVYQVDWQVSLADYQIGDKSKKIAKANAVKLPHALGDSEPADFTRAGEEDDDNAIAKVTRLGEPTVTTIFLQRTSAGLVLSGSNQSIDLKKSPDITTIRGLLGRSTRIGKRGLVQTLIAERKAPPAWNSALLRYCAYVELDSEEKVQIGKWQIRLDPRLGVVIEKA